MKSGSENTEDAQDVSPTLGDVLYASKSKTLVAESEWAALVRSCAVGDQSALHALYERAHRPVFTLMIRMTNSRETAEELTLDVFHDVWRRASAYDAVNGTVLGWIMNQARSRAIDRVRFEQRKKRVPPEGVAVEESPIEFRDVVESGQQRDALTDALKCLTPDERMAIETAYFSELSYAQVAERLKQPIGTIKTRIRSALFKLRQAMADGEQPS